MKFTTKHKIALAACVFFLGVLIFIVFGDFKEIDSMCEIYTKEVCENINTLKGIKHAQCKNCMGQWPAEKEQKRPLRMCPSNHYYNNTLGTCVKSGSSRNSSRNSSINKNKDKNISSSSSSQARQVGSSSGMSSRGSSSRGSGGCFPFGTRILMEDGTIKQIQNICLGDKTKGGIVTGFHVFPLNKNDIFNYKGVIVAGSHRVLENNKWIKVRDSQISKLHSKEIDNNNNMLYDFDTTNHRIIIADNPDVIFADYIEVDDNNNLIDNIEKMILNKIHLKKMKQQKSICYE